MKRKHWIIGTLILIGTLSCLLAKFVSARVHLAKSYMQQQIERLDRDGFHGYEIVECNYLGFSDFEGFMCITLTARRKAGPSDSSYGRGDGYHYIEVDFPWFSSRRPEHRI